MKIEYYFVVKLFESSRTCNKRTAPERVVKLFSKHLTVPLINISFIIVIPASHVISQHGYSFPPSKKWRQPKSYTISAVMSNTCATTKNKPEAIKLRRGIQQINYADFGGRTRNRKSISDPAGSVPKKKLTFLMTHAGYYEESGSFEWDLTFTELRLKWTVFQERHGLFCRECDRTNDQFCINFQVVTKHVCRSLASIWTRGIENLFIRYRKLSRSTRYTNEIYTIQSLRNLKSGKVIVFKDN